MEHTLLGVALVERTAAVGAELVLMSFLALAAREADVPAAAPLPPVETTTPHEPDSPAVPSAGSPHVTQEPPAELAGGEEADEVGDGGEGDDVAGAAPRNPVPAPPGVGAICLAQMPWPILALVVGLAPLTAGVLGLGALVVLGVAANVLLFGLAWVLQAGPMSLHPRGPDVVGILTMGSGVLLPVLLSGAVTSSLALGAYLGWRKAVQPRAPSPRAASRALRTMMAWPVVCGVGAGCCGFPVSVACAAGAVVAQLAALGGGCMATLLGCGFLCLAVPTTLVLMGGPLVLAALVAPWGAASAGAGVVGGGSLEGDPP